MSEQNDHLDPKETTEGKLCAYLEGELPDSDRAEIEQHLAANPQHRKLLADLARTREWMRSIPHESAPAELAESFQGQIERSMLLESNAQKSMISIARWPQFAMMAAIVVLTLGLGATLVIMLRGPGRTFSLNHGIPASGPSKGPTPIDSSSTTQPQSVLADADTNPARANPVVTMADTPTPVSPSLIAQAPPAGASPAQPIIAPSGDLLPQNNVRTTLVDAAEPSLDELKAKVISSGYHLSLDQKVVCFVVTTDQPVNVLQQVNGFIVRHQLVADQPVNLLTPANTTSQLVSAENAAPAQNAMPRSRGAQLQQQVSGSSNSNNGGQLNSVSQPPGQSSNPPAPQKLSPGANDLNANDAPANKQGNNGNVVGPNNVQPFTAVPSTNPSNETVFVARKLSTLQLELLSASLAEGNPSVKRITLSDGMADQKSGGKPIAANEVITRGQMLVITVAELVGPGVEKTNGIRVGNDGNITLPMIDSIPAAGVTAEDLRQRIAAKYRDANLNIPNATVTILSPTTQPVRNEVADQQKRVDQPKASTQPAVGTTGTDVVVIIEKADSSVKQR